MKKQLLLSFSLLTISFVTWSQDPVFNNASEDNNLYSNTGNWINGVKPGDNGRAQFNGKAQLDESVTLSYLKASVMNAGLLNGAGTLTLTGGDGTFVDIQQFTTGELLLDVPIIYTATDPAGRNLFRVDADGGVISFGPNSDLDLSSTNPMRLQGFPGAGAFGDFNFDGILRGASNIQLGINVDTLFFGATADNSNYTGQIIYFAPGGTIIANNNEGNVLVAQENKIQVNNNNGTLVLNGRNIYHGYIQIDGGNAFRWGINADQPNIERLVIPGSGAITLALGNEVDSVHFSHLDGDGTVLPSSWAAGASLDIENFQNAALRFGTDATGLTAEQLTQISIGGGTPTLNSNGFLVDPQMNTAPSSSQEALVIAEGFSTREINLSEIVNDAQNDNVTLSGASSSVESIVTVSLTDNLLTITEVASGTSTVSFTATDEYGLAAELTFDVTVDQLPDADGDGVPDADDLCPNTPNAENVNADGCSDSQIDEDGDGVFNSADLCASTASGATVDTDGCSDAQKDTDEDGVTDDLDECAGTPTGSNVDEKGCVIVLSASIISSDISVYPNPTQDYLMIKNLSKWKGGTLVIQDMSGRKVLSQRISAGQTEISVNQLKAGRYILQLQNGSGTETMTFMRGK